MADLTLKNNAITWTLTDEGNVIVLDLRSSEYLSVNSSAASLWSILASGAPAETLIYTLQESFGISRTAAERDVDAFLGALRERDLLDEPVQ